MDRQVDQRRDVELIPREWDPEHAKVDILEELRVLTVESLTGGSAAAIADLIASGAPDIVDLRGLVWGLESQAIQVADLFVAQGTIASWKGREAGSEVIEATGETGLNVPLILIDGETEGVGEVLASAFKRSGAVLLGQPSLGHAPHMQIVRRGDLNLWIPVGRWLGPDDEPLRGAGLEPDEEIPAPDEDEEGDPVLDRAIERLTSVEVPEAA
jgi:C-terminal processing protease CtpA/Prc